MTALRAKSMPFGFAPDAYQVAQWACFRCGSGAADVFGICSAMNRWLPLCVACKRGVIHCATDFVAELGGKRFIAWGDFKVETIVARFRPEGDEVFSCHRCTDGRGVAWWSLFSRRRQTLLCVECDIELNRRCLIALGFDDAARRLRAYRPRLVQAAERILGAREQVAA